VLLADGGEAIADLAVLRQQSGLFGPVASDPTAWRVLDAIDTPGSGPLAGGYGQQPRVPRPHPQPARPRCAHKVLRRVAITTPIRAAIAAAEDWVPALDGDGSLRDGAELVELTNHLDPGVLASLPAGTRLICRGERPHPGAQLTLFDTINGMRHQVFATDAPHGGGSIQFLEVRHRCHARVEDRIRTGKTTGFGRLPSRQFAINVAWLELALTGIDTATTYGDSRQARRAFSAADPDVVAAVQVSWREADEIRLLRHER
jgi:hypothetical protein